MPKLPDDTAIQWETVGLPLAKGVDLRTPGRAIEMQRMLRFRNGRFASADAGIEKRRGHQETLVRSDSSLVGHLLTPGYPAHVNHTPPPGGIVGTTKSIRPAENWLYGYGIDTGSTLLSGYKGPSSNPPYAGQVAGVYQRDKEALFWDGFRTYSWPSLLIRKEGWQQPCTSFFPSFKSRAIAKVPTAQPFADSAANEKIVVVAYYDPGTTKHYLSVYDRATNAPYLAHVAVGSAGARHVRVLPSGDWIHVLVSTASNCTMFSIHESTPTEVRAGLVGPLFCSGSFDVRQVNDQVWAWCRATPTDTAELTYHGNDGSLHEGFAGTGSVVFDTVGDLVKTVSIAFAPLSNDVCLQYTQSPTLIRVRVYDPAGGPLGSVSGITTETPIHRHTVEAYYVPNTDGIPSFRCYWDQEDLTSNFPPKIGRRDVNRYATDGVQWTYFAQLASHAFRVGTLPFVFVRSRYFLQGAGSRVQHTYYILDPTMKPVGKMERGTAADVTLTQYGLPGVNYYERQGERNRLRWHGVMVYRTRVDSSFNNQYDEESLKYFELDFMPRLRTAQYGRCTYIAGAQLSVYDGREVVEQGFHEAPELQRAQSANVPGGLVPEGSYRYKARWAYKNAQGEEIIGPALISLPYSVGVGHNVMDVYYMSTTFTRKVGAYLLIYRNEPGGTQWYLVSSRDPSSPLCPKNDPTTDLIHFQDNVPNTTGPNPLIAREKDPGDSGELEPFSAPACEIVTSGRDRLWTAGGELAPGDIMPSKLYVQGTGAAFNDQLLTSIDRDIDPVTGFAFMGNSTFVYKRNRVYAMEADGPNNLLFGGFDVPRLIAADTGATGPEGIVLTTQGVVFRSPVGFKMLATNYQLVDIGDPVRTTAENAELTGALLVPTDNEVRFYSLDGDCYVFDYSNGEWSTWTNLECAGVARNPLNDYAIIGKLTGHAWEEREDQVTDGGRGIEFVWRTAWIHRGLQSFQRIRRMALLGDKRGEYVVRVRIYYDDKDYPEDEFTWDPAVDLNPSLWGDNNEIGGGGWGEGLWGDSKQAELAEVMDNAPDVVRSNVHLLRHRLKRQKCSRFSIEVSDQGGTTRGPAFTEVAFQLGSKGGLTRAPARTFGS